MQREALVSPEGHWEAVQGTPGPPHSGAGTGPSSGLSGHQVTRGEEPPFPETLLTYPRCHSDKPSGTITMGNVPPRPGSPAPHRQHHLGVSMEMPHPDQLRPKRWAGESELPAGSTKAWPAPPSRRPSHTAHSGERAELSGTVPPCSEAVLRPCCASWPWPFNLCAVLRDLILEEGTPGGSGYTPSRAAPQEGHCQHSSSCSSRGLRTREPPKTPQVHVQEPPAQWAGWGDRRGGLSDAATGAQTRTSAD